MSITGKVFLNIDSLPSTCKQILNAENDFCVCLFVFPTQLHTFTYPNNCYQRKMQHIKHTMEEVVSGCTYTILANCGLKVPDYLQTWTPYNTLWGGCKLKCIFVWFLILWTYLVTKDGPWFPVYPRL